jgi:hypothetical protein
MVADSVVILAEIHQIKHPSSLTVLILTNDTDVIYIFTTTTILCLQIDDAQERKKRVVVVVDRQWLVVVVVSWQLKHKQLIVKEKPTKNE